MQARIARESEIVVIHLSGRLDVETAEPFRKACLSHLKSERVVFDFRSLSFVGSSGILPFLETMQEFATVNVNGFKFSGVGPEFRKVFAATPLNVIEIFETAHQAVHAFLNPQPIVAPLQAVPIVASGEDAEEEAATPAANYGFLSLRPEPAAEPVQADIDEEV